jgi:hypothetical protein
MSENNNFEKTAAQAAAFQKIWMDSMSKIMQTAFTLGPNTPPPDVLRQMRSGLLQALAQSWEEFMRSPEFLAGMKQWMNNAIAFRKMTNDFMANVRNEMQAPSRDDIGSIMLTVRHMEKRLLDRMDALDAQVRKLDTQAGNGKSHRPGAKSSASGRKPARKSTVPGGNPTIP